MQKDSKDFLDQELHPGDEVVILHKESCATGLRTAELVKGIFLRKGRWGYEFHIPRWDDEYTGMGLLRIQFPYDRVIKINKEA